MDWRGPWNDCHKTCERDAPERWRVRRGAVNLFLQARPNAPKDTLAVFTKMLKAFVEANEDPMKSPHYQSKGGDDLSYVIKVLPLLHAFPRMATRVVIHTCLLSRPRDPRAFHRPPNPEHQTTACRPAQGVTA